MAVPRMLGAVAVRSGARVTLGILLSAVTAAAVPSSAPAAAGPAPDAPRAGGPLAGSGSGPGSLNAVSCLTRSACMAVGVGSGSQQIAEWWNGKNWRLMRRPVQPRPVPSIDVSCTRATGGGPECMVVGTTAAGTRGRAAAELWTGHSWRDLSLPSPGSLGVLGSVSCLSARWCLAVGYDRASGGVRYLAEQWNGARWRLLRVPTAAGNQFGGLDAVACATHTFCLVLGDYDNGKGKITAVTGVWNGTAWRTLPSRGLGRGVQLLSAACTSAARCVAVGENSTPQSLQPAAARWDGRNWTTISPGKLGPGGTLDDVSCPSASSCTAAGAFFASPALLLESWNGTSWHVMAGASPGSSFSELNSVSCGDTRDCLAAGDSQEGYNAPTFTLAERWDGSKWHLTATP